MNPAASSNRPGISLVEVIVASVLIAAMAIGSMTSLARHRTAMAQTLRRAAAIEAADGLIQSMTVRRGGLPTRQAGAFEDPGGLTYHWRAEPVQSTTLCGEPVWIVELQLSDRPGDRPLLTVRYVVVDPRARGAKG